MSSNKIILPSFISTKMVFQQNVPLVIRGTAAPSATITLQVSKDPTDGRRVSKLDTDYGVILGLETTTSGKGEFQFTLPEYKASTDSYTFVFKCLNQQVTIDRISCGDVWVFLGSEFLSVPIKESKTPPTPLKRKVMDQIRFFSPPRNGISKNEYDISFYEKKIFEDESWIDIKDTNKLADTSATAFSFAYTISEQVSYPIGVVDLAYKDSTILNFLSPSVIDNYVALHDYLEELGLLIDEESYRKMISVDRKRRNHSNLIKDIEESKSFFDFDLEKDETLRAIEGKKTYEETIEEVSDIDFPSGTNSSLKNRISPETPLSNSGVLDFNMLSDISVNKTKREENKQQVKNRFRISTLYKAKLYPFRGMPVRGFVFSPQGDEKSFGRYDLLLKGLLGTLSEIFEPKEVFDDSSMPSILFLTMHPLNVDYDYPYKVIEYNENLLQFTKLLNMPSGIISLHDLLLPDKTKSYILGIRLATAALGIHVTPKLPKSCPSCQGVERTGNKLILEFENLGDGLRLKEGETELRGFAICGEDRIYRQANAKILHGVRVMVWRDDIDMPIGVTYGFSPFPHEATFKNLSDLPVLPFRFDKEPSFFAPDLFFTNCDKLDFVGIKDKGDDFEVLKVYKTIKGNGIISLENQNKTEGSSSLHIKYETENQFYIFEADLSYASLDAPFTLKGRNTLTIDIFNPDTNRKELFIEGFETIDVKQQLTWQSFNLKYKGEGDISLSSFKITIKDTAPSGEIYIDNLRFT